MRLMGFKMEEFLDRQDFFDDIFTLYGKDVLIFKKEITVPVELEDASRVRGIIEALVHFKEFKGDDIEEIKSLLLDCKCEIMNLKYHRLQLYSSEMSHKKNENSYQEIEDLISYYDGRIYFLNLFYDFLSNGEL